MADLIIPDSNSVEMELAGDRMLTLCYNNLTNKKEPTETNTGSDGCDDWALLYADEFSCQNANAIDGLETKRGTNLNSQPCLWIDYKKISTDDARWLQNKDGQPRLQVDLNAET